MGRAWRSSAPGPAGAFAAAALLRARGDVEIDLFERLPTAWGLLRAGVAPDHQEIKRLEDRFERETLARGCRFLGNVEVGTDVSHAELMEHYSAVVYATGAQTDKSLGIPGEDLPGSWAATEFVAWYNGHPDYRDREFDLSARARGGDRQRQRRGRRDAHAHAQRDELARTDVADHALEALRASRDRGGRRARPPRARPGRVHERRAARAGAAWTASTLASSDVELDPVSRAWLDEEGTFTARKNVAAAARVRRPRGRRRRAAPDRAALPALAGRDPRRRPGRGDRRAAATRSCAATAARCGPARSTSRSRRSRPASSCAPSATAPCRCPTCRSTSARFVLPNERGRVLDRRRRAAARRLRRRLDQARADRHPRHQQARRGGDRRLPRGGPAARCPSPSRRREPIDALLAEREPDVVTADGWHAIDALERERGRGAGRPRVKLASRDELLAAALR